MYKSLFVCFLSCIFIFSCSDDKNVPLSVDFSATVSGEAPDAKITLTNLSTGASSYSWTFSEGANITTSSKETPPVIQVDKSGGIVIKLVASNGKDELETSQSIEVNGFNAVDTYSDIEFGLKIGDSKYGRMFSFNAKKMYFDTEINENNGKLIHLVFGSKENTTYYFQSPTNAGINIPNASKTKITNYEPEPSITLDEFDAMSDDGALIEMEVIDDNNSFGNSSIPGIVLFELASGKKGLIKTKAVNNERLLVDIKIQKY